MAKDTRPDIASQPRHVYGPRPIGALVPRLTRPAFRRISPAAAQVMADWASIVGPALAAVTTPHRLSAGQLTIACSGPIAMELQHLATELIARINTHLGTSTVKALRFLQTLPPAPASPQAQASPPTVADRRRAEAAVSDLPQGDLRSALASLGAAVLSAKGHTKAST
ncbi:MAG TPA: DciA family protein [Acetobacteraceae bacterium]|nr:DciA family protein [Acetobacteraceae bacterium]